jgi:hypothetical protein
VNATIIDGAKHGGLLEYKYISTVSLKGHMDEKKSKVRFNHTVIGGTTRVSLAALMRQ